MSGTRFVVLLLVLAVAAAGMITVGAPSPEAAEREPPVEQTLEREPAPTPAPASAAPAAEPRLHDAIDGASTTSADTAAGWAYRRTAVADLDVDAVPERLVVASDVFVTEDGEPMWGDIHRWAVYVEEDDGTRTLVYSALVPPGGVSAAAGSAGAGGPRRIVVIEQGPRRARILLAAYDGPGRSRLLDVAGDELAAWVDRVAEETE